MFRVSFKFLPISEFPKRSISKLIDFTETLSNTTPLLNKKIVTQKLLNKVINKMSQEAEKNGIKFISIFGNDIPDIMFGDYHRTSATLKYLITNAIERSNSKGEIIVSVDVFDQARQEIQYDKPKALVLQFIVKSSTQRLYEEEQQLIYRSNKNPASIFEELNFGMDLNIAIVKQLVYQMGGELDVRSNDNEGTVFVCFLPLTLPLTDNVIEEIY